MKIKRYIVDTMPQAMQQIRSELGHDAVIISTKDFYVGGFLGMFRKKRIEVVAAADKPAAPSNAMTKNVEPRPARNDVQPRASQPREVSASLLEAIAASSKAAAPAVLQPVKPAPAPAQVVPKREVTQSQPTELTGLREDRIADELRQVKETLAKLSRHPNLHTNEGEFANAVVERLMEQEIQRDLCQRWLDMFLTMTEASPQERTAAQFEQFVREELRKLMNQTAPEGIRPDTQIVYFAGPTGVGKTTTIAKLAAEQLFRYQRKVGFITSDTYRIAAVEQLRTYATILNIPLEVVNSPADVGRAMKALEHCDLIFMDTAGRNFRNEILVSELNSYIKSAETSETYLVLSLTSKFSDMAKIVGHFQKFLIDKVIYTKKDETASYGAIINIMQSFQLPLSYMTFGQNVPEDIEIAQPEELIQLILGEQSYG